MAKVIIRRREPDEPPASKWERRARAFDEKNPHVFTELERICAEVRELGITRCGFEMIIGQLRWQSMIRTKGDPYKINQNFAAYYGRKMIRLHPEWEGMFNFRELRS